MKVMIMTVVKMMIVKMMKKLIMIIRVMKMM